MDSFCFLMALEELHREGLVFFNQNENVWDLNNKKIKEFMESDNVVDFIDKILLDLPDETKDILHIASCIGNTFLMEELVVATKQSPQFLSRAIFPAMKANIVVPLNLQDEWMTGIDDNILLESEYRFIHDKMQQSAYHLKSINETKRVHLIIARGWANHFVSEDDFTRIITIADQFDKGLVYVVDNDEKKRICELNYRAGSIALSSVAQERAFYYGNTALSLLTEDSWLTDYDLTFKIYSLVVSSAFLSHRFETAEKYSKVLLENTTDKFEKAKILHLKSLLYRVMNKTAQSIETLKEGLILYNKRIIIKKPTILDILFAVAKNKYYLRFKHKDISELSGETSLQDRLLYLLAQSFAEELYFSGQMMNWVYVLLTWANTTFSTQSSHLRAMSYLINGVIWPHSPYSHKLMDETRELIEKNGFLEHRSTYYCVASILHMPWHIPIHDILPLLKKSFHVSAQTGNLDFLSLTYQFETLFNTALPVSEKIKELEQNGVFVKEISLRTFISMKLFHQFFRNLSGDAKKNCWDDEYFSLTDITQYCSENNYGLGFQFLYSLQLSSAIHFQEYSTAASISKKLLPYLPTCYRSNSYLRIARFFFFLFMSESINYPNLSFFAKIKSNLLMRKIYRYFSTWSKTCPSNFLYMLLIMDAEKARLHKKPSLAIEKYDAAIIEARKNQNPEYVGFALERMASLYLDSRYKDKAMRTLEDACKVYEGWGALGKVRFIRERYPT